jgi:hypothetical protein
MYKTFDAVPKYSAPKDAGQQTRLFCQLVKIHVILKGQKRRK